MRLVGMGDVVVAVPTSWETRVDGCAGRGGSVVFADSRTISGCGAPGSRTSTLMIAKHGSGALECGGRCTDIGAKINGLMVSHNGGICLKTAQGPCTITFAADGVIFRVRYHGAKADDFVWTVLRSLTELPAGFTTVPSCGYGSSVKDAQSVLAKAGLTGESPEVDWPHYATGTDPEAGSVVPEGATVEISIGDG